MPALNTYYTNCHCITIQCSILLLYGAVLMVLELKIFKLALCPNFLYKLDTRRTANNDMKTLQSASKNRKQWSISTVRNAL